MHRIVGLLGVVFAAWTVMSGEMRPLPSGALKLKGPVDDAIGKSVSNWTLGKVPHHEFADFFRKGRPQFALGEMWGKFVRAAVMQYRYTGDKRICEVVEDAVKDALAAERTNGSISCNPPECQPGGKDGDLWERKYVMLALERYLENVRNDPAVLASLERQADCIIDQIGEPPKADIRSLGWSANHIESSTLLEPFVNLYRLTGKQRYLDFAAYIVKSGGAQGYDLVREACDNVPPHEMGGPYPKAYEMLSFFEGLLEYHKVTGDETAGRACLNLFTNVLTNEITIIGNGGGDRPHHPKVQGEAWDHTAFEQTNPAMKRMMETCVGVTWLKFCGRILAMTGDPRAADAMERYVYNGLLGAMTPEGDGFSYVNLLNGVKTTNKGWGWTFPTGPVTCCNLNGPIGLAYVPYYAVMQADGAAIVNFYEAFEATVRGRTAVMRLSAPHGILDGESWRLNVGSSQKSQLKLRLRIPAWSAATSVRLNDVELSGVRPGSYFDIDREWQDGDIVEIRFDFKARLVSAPHGSNRCGDEYAAVVWGPVVLARDENTDPEFSSAVRVQTKENVVVPIRRKTPSLPGHRLEFEVPVEGGAITMCDYASVDSWHGKRVMTWLPLPGVKVSSFGYDEKDSTRFIQAAIDSGATKIVFDRQKGPWRTLPLFGRANQELVFEPGAVLEAKPGEFKGIRDCLLRLEGVTNVTIRGAKGAVMRMHRSDYAKAPYRRSEWRHALAIRDSRNIKVVGMTFEESGGDGVVISGTSEGVELLNCTMSRNFRQGVSVISCRDFLAEGCTFKETRGTNPESGIDLEPDGPNDHLVSCMIRNCRSVGNAGSAFHVAPVKLDSQSDPVGVRFENCISEDDGMGVEFALYRKDNYPTGRVVFANCSFHRPRIGCLFENKPAGTVEARFAGCRFEDAKEADLLFRTEQWDFDPPDGIVFTDVMFRQPVARPLVHFPCPGFGRPVESISGKVRVESPSGVQELGLTPEWCRANVRRAEGETPLPRAELDCATVWPLGEDTDQMRMFRPAAVAHGQRFVLRVDSPRRVRMMVRQIAGSSGIYSPIPLKLNRVGGGFHQEIPMPHGGPCEVAFEAGKPGWYTMDLDAYHSRFSLDSANLPVAIDASVRYREFVTLPGSNGFSFTFKAEKGCPFSLLTRVIYEGDEYVCRLYDASGRVIIEKSLPKVWSSMSAEAEGIVRAEFTRTCDAGSRGGNVFVDLTGVPGLLNLIPQQPSNTNH